MFKYWILFLALSAVAWSAPPATPEEQAKPPNRKHKITQHKAPQSRTGTSHSGTSHTARKPRTAPPARRSYQQAPTPERYKEIQQVLVDKGYFKGNVDGHWGPDSVESLRRFQSDQNLDPDGKLGALSLIALGLGPKRLSAQTAPSTTPPPSVQR